MLDLLWLLFLFQIKHLVVDFFLQNRFPYMWVNKHRVFHPGGWLHAGSHAVATFLIFAHWHRPTIGPGIPWVDAAIILSVVELFIHFLIDLCKMRFNAWMKWQCHTSPQFWNLLGIDQFLHQLTYLWLAGKWLF